jgi:AraC-like DNA-binding protein
LQHIEFFDNNHFQYNYYRQGLSQPLSLFIDFIWQTKFDDLWSQYPEGFSDVLFPNTGYTYLVNLGTPFVMQVGSKKIAMRSDGFLPRPESIECFHEKDNCLFGIKFRISPVIFEKKINFSEYQGYIYPLSYLMNKDVLQAIKSAKDFKERFMLVCQYFEGMYNGQAAMADAASIVSEVMQRYGKHYSYDTTVDNIASDYAISTRTLQRYFQTTTGISPKKAFQILRMRQAIEAISQQPSAFSFETFGYYDFSHFYKHLRQFLKKDTLDHLKPHLRMLQSLRRPQ